MSAPSSATDTTSWPICRLQLLRRPLGDDPAVVDDRQAVAQLVGLLEVLRGQEDGRALGVDAAHLVPDRQPRGRVEPGRRLVEEQHLGRVDERAGEVEPPLHPARVGLRAPLRGVGEPDQLEQFLRTLPAALGPVIPYSPHCSSSSSRPVWTGSRPISCSATPIRRRTCAAVRDDVEAGHRGAAGGRREQRAEHPHGGRLAGAVRAEEAEHLAARDGQVDVSHRLDPALERAPQRSGHHGVLARAADLIVCQPVRQRGMQNNLQIRIATSSQTIPWSRTHRSRDAALGVDVASSA